MDKLGRWVGGSRGNAGHFWVKSYIENFCIVLCKGLGSYSLRLGGGITKMPHTGDTESVYVCG